jgi:tetratricopeptide (TPR) repeat protein
MALSGQGKSVSLPAKPIRFGAVVLIIGGSFLTALTAQGQEALLQARRALESGHAQEAAQLLEDFRRSAPTNPEGCLLLGIAYGNLGETEKSLAMFKQFARMEPNRPEAHNNLGAAYLRLGDVKNAEDSFRRAVKLSPLDSAGLYNLGALLNAKHSYAEAKPLLERCFRTDRSVATAYELAVSAAGLGDRKAALKILDAVPGPQGQDALPWLKLQGTLNLDEGNTIAAVQALERVLTLAPHDEEALYGLAAAKIKSNDVTSAIALLDRKFAALSSSARHVREGTFLASAGAQREAMALFQRATDEDPTSYEAFYNLAVLRLDSSADWNGARTAAEQALTLKSTGEVQVLLGDIEEAQGHYDRALDHYQEAVRLDPDKDDFVFDLGSELLQHENHEAARSLFQAATQRFPSSARIYLGLGTSQFMGGDFTASVDAFLRAVDLAPDFQPAYVFLGEAFSFSGGRSDDVIAKLERVAEREPANGVVQYYYASALISRMHSTADLKDAHRAQEALRRAQAALPKDARVYYQAGELATLQKQNQAALSNYRDAVELDPNFPEALYKLGQTYIHLGMQREGKETLARHRMVVAKSEADVTRRNGAIQSFVLKMRNPR